MNFFLPTYIKFYIISLNLCFQISHFLSVDFYCFCLKKYYNKCYRLKKKNNIILYEKKAIFRLNNWVFIVIIYLVKKQYYTNHRVGTSCGILNHNILSIIVSMLIMYSNYSIHIYSYNLILKVLILVKLRNIL